MSARSHLRAWSRRYLVALGLATVVTVSGVVGVNAVIDRKISGIERVDVEVTEVDPGEPANYLVIGSDTRQFVESEQEAESFGSASEVGGQRSDTIMVVHVDPRTKEGLLVSFPRDLWVDIPGVGESKINAAYNHGAQKVVDTLQANFDIEINHYLEIDFATFQGIVDALGGVPVYFPAPARDANTGLSAAGFGAGCYRLGGADALAYVRSREYEQFVDGRWVSDPTGDIGRIQRQQSFLRRLASEAVSQSLRSPLTANRVANEVLDELKADASLDRDSVFGLVNAFRNVDPNDAERFPMETIPWTAGTAGRQSVLFVDREAAEPILARLRAPIPEPEDEALPDVVPSSVRVRVLNGAGVQGLAGDTLAALQAEGFAPSGVGNEPIVDAATEIRHVPGAQDKARLVRAYLGVGELVESAGVVDADVEVVLRADFEGQVTAPGGGTASTDTTAGPAAPATPAPPGTEAPATTGEPAPQTEC